MVTRKTLAEKAAAPPVKPSVKAAKTARPTGGPKPPRVKPAGDDGPAELSEKVKLFVAEYLVDLNATRAYMRVFPGATPATARQEGWRIQKQPEVREAIRLGMEARQRRAELDADAVVQRLTMMATADERELMELRRGCCRFCWGADHRYQFTAAEMERAEAEHAAAVERDEAKGDFDPKGGTGFNANDPPNPECPECFGDGRVRTVFKDTRYLSPGAAMLFAGIKETKDGLEVKLHSRADALTSLGRHFGIFEKDNRRKLEVDAAEELKQFLAARGGSRLPLGSEG